MADGHLGYVMPIGGVAAYREKVSVVGVGFDIACGNAAIRTDLTLDDTRTCRTPAGARRRDPGRRSPSASAARTGRTMRRSTIRCSRVRRGTPSRARHATGCASKARAQLGTVGSGNHYVDVFADETGAIWVGVHFGSRGFGHTVASGFLALSQGGKWGARAPEREVLLPLDKPIGQDYWALMTLAGEYAYAGREWVARKVVSILGGTRAGARAQPPQLRLARGARRPSSSSSSARARRRRFPGRRGSSAARWATTR